MMIKRLTLAVLVGILLAGCSAMPLRTMWQMARLGPEGLLEVKPEEIRAAVLGETPFMSLDGMDRVALGIELEREDGAEYEFRFDLTEHTAAESFRLPPAADEMSWRAYAMDEAGHAEFIAMQQRFATWMGEEGIKPLRATISVRFGTGGDGLAALSEEAEAAADPELEQAMRRWDEDGLPLRIDLQLDAQQGYFTLIRKTRVPFQFTEQRPPEP